MDKQFATAQSMLVALRTKHISAQELLAWHLERIACYNPDLNSIVTFNEEQAHSARSRLILRSPEGFCLGHCTVCQ